MKASSKILYMRRWNLPLQILSLLLVLFGSSAGGCSAYAHTDVVLQLKWFHQFQFAGYYAALEKGYYDEEGLNVKIREGGPQINVVREVLAGHADFGVGTSRLIANRVEGNPLVVLCAIFQHSPYVLIVRDDVVGGLKGLVGKNVILETQAISSYITDASPSTLGIGFYGDNLFTTEKMIEYNPDIVRSFYKASLKGWDYS